MVNNQILTARKMIRQGTETAEKLRTIKRSMKRDKDNLLSRGGEDHDIRTQLSKFL